MSETAVAIAQVLANVTDVRKVVFLIGAGLSVNSGFDVWSVATMKAIDNARSRGLPDGAFAYAKERFDAGDYYAVFGILRDNLTPAAYRTLVLETFHGTSQANATQLLLLKVQSRGVITTNFDECLTSAHVLIRKTPPRTSLRDILASSDFYVAQPHGTLQSFDTMVLTLSDWERVLREGLFKQLLEQVVSSGQLVLLGYSAGDPDFHKIWDELLHERIFVDPALLCCSTGSIPAAKQVEFRARNIQVIEFDDPSKSFSYLDELLTALADLHAASDQAPTSPRVAQKIEDIERYVLLCMEFGTERSSRLELVCQAIIIEKLIAGEKLATNDLLAHVTNTLGETSSEVIEASKKAFTSLVANSSIVSEKKLLVMTEKTRRTLDERVQKTEAAELAALERVLDSHKVAPPGVPMTIDILRTLLDRTLSAFGMEVAEFFLYARPAKIPAEKIDSIVTEYCVPLGIPPSTRHTYSVALKSLVIQPHEDFAAMIFKKLQAYFIASAFVLNPSSEKLLADYSAGHIVYLDSSIILPAIAIGHPSHSLYRSMLSSTIRLGMKLRVSREMLNEVTSNLKVAGIAFKRFQNSAATLSDVLAGYLILQGRGNGNVFIEGFSNERELDESITPEVYLRMVAGDGPYTEHSVAALLVERYEIELDLGTEADLDGNEVQRLTETVAHIRKMGNRFKTDLLCKHEAVQFALIHQRRNDNPDLVSKIWFVTTDFFFVELQRLEVAGYPLPVSYTPRFWFQYLNLLDHEARGSEHYARLQQRMKYGVAAGALGLNAIYQILKEKRSLIEKGVATVQQMAQAIVEQYHVRRSVENYTFGRRQGTDVEVPLDVLSKQVRTAVSKLETIRTLEVDKLKEEKDSALARALTAEKLLAKKKYALKVTQRGLKKKHRRR